MLIFGGFVILLLIIVLIRVKTNNKFEIKTNDIVVALVPIVLILFLTGQIDKIKIGDLEIEKALKEAYAEEITQDVSDVSFASEATVQKDVQEVVTERKGSERQLELIADKNIEGLTFALGYPYYDQSVIQKYFKRLPSLKYVVINDESGKFFGLLDAQVCLRYYEDTSNRYSWARFERSMVQNDKSYIQNIPSFVSNEFAISQNEKRLDAMEKFKSSKMSILPVVENDKFIGILERDNLANEILIGLSNSIQGFN